MAARSDIRRTATIRASSPEDAGELIENMREIDRQEWRAILETEPNRAEMLRMMRMSPRCRTAVVGGKVAAMYGVAVESYLSNEGLVWLLGTDVLSEPGVKAEFARRSRAELSEVVRGYKRLWNIVAIENKIAVRWLKWLGFSFPHHTEMRMGGLQFREFEMEI